jgi:peptidyl-prolyl cis-trans isomerase-like protein 2
LNKGYYQKTIFHRLIRGFMIQGGDPTGTGSGGESIWKRFFKDEISPTQKFQKRGVLAMANRGPGTNGSQFFITFGPCPHLNNNHTIFGRMTAGEKTLTSMEGVGTTGDSPIEKIVIIETKVIADPYDRLLHKEQYAKELKESRAEKRQHLEKLKLRAMGSTQATDEVGKFLKKRKV